MKAILTRTSSGSSVRVHSSFIPGSPRLSLSRHDSVSGVFSGEKNSPRILLHLDVNHRPIRRAFSEPDMIPFATDVPGGFTRLTRARSQLFPARIPEEECVSDGEEEAIGGVGSLLEERGLDHERDYFPRSGIPVEELGISVTELVKEGCPVVAEAAMTSDQWRKRRSEQDRRILSRDVEVRPYESSSSKKLRQILARG